MRFLSIDFHVSVISDVRHFLTDLGHTVDCLSLSGHAWVFGRKRDKVRGLEGMSQNSFGRDECERFVALHAQLLNSYDGFIVTHSPCLAGLYESTGKPVICVASTRYNTFCETPESRDWLDHLLVRMHGSGQLILIANNAYDAWDIERHMGIKPKTIPSFCGYTGVQWSPTEPPIIHGRRNLCGLRRLRHGHRWNQVASARCCVCVPYNVSLMSVFERHTMGMPILMPSVRWTMENPGSLSDLRHFGRPSDVEIEAALRLADWYSGELPGLIYFDSENHLTELLQSDISPVHGVQKRKNKITELWKHLI